MTDLTTEQQVPFTFGAVDGRGRPVAIEGTPTAVSSDGTVATVTMTDGGDGKTWHGVISAVQAGAARIVITADADVSPEVNNVIGTADITVTLDPRTAARTARMDLGAPEDKPA